MASPSSLDQLVACLARLPGVGRRSAERLAMSLLRAPGLVRDLAAALRAAGDEIRCCARCGAITDVGHDPCRLCTDPRRDSSLLCVVEEPADILPLERSLSYKGRYHVLMGRISPMTGLGVDDLRIASLMQRLGDEGIREVILALGTDVEGDATASFLAERLRDRQVVVSRLAFGLPAGSGIMYSDPVTLGRAIEGRQKV